jgi:hypothetical protein
MNYRETTEKIQGIKSEIYGAFADERAGDLSKLGLSGRLEILTMDLVTLGRLTVLEQFDAMCAADGFVGFSDAEWAVVKKFFAFNKQISGWDKK